MKICLACACRHDDAEWRCPACGHAPDIVDGHRCLTGKPEGTAGSFEPGTVEFLAGVEPSSFWFRSRRALVVAFLGRYFPAARTFLEIDCGTGFLLEGVRRAFPDLAAFGADVDDAALLAASRRVPPGCLYRMDARRIPFESEFDVVGAFDVLEHVAEDAAVLAAVFRSLRPGGGLILGVPQHPALWSRSDELARHARRYTARDLREKVEGAGFRIVRATSFVSLLLPLMVASRLWQRVHPTFDVMHELRLGPVANRMLERVLALERWGIGHGVSLPWGGSLFVVAVKP